MTIEVKVTITAPDGRVLDVLIVNGGYLKGTAVFPEDMLSQCILETLQENFEDVKKVK